MTETIDRKTYPDEAIVEVKSEKTSSNAFGLLEGLGDNTIHNLVYFGARAIVIGCS